MPAGRRDRAHFDNSIGLACIAPSTVSPRSAEHSHAPLAAHVNAEIFALHRKGYDQHHTDARVFALVFWVCSWQPLGECEPLDATSDRRDQLMQELPADRRPRGSNLASRLSVNQMSQDSSAACASTSLPRGPDDSNVQGAQRSPACSQSKRHPHELVQGGRVGEALPACRTLRRLPHQDTLHRHLKDLSAQGPWDLRDLQHRVRNVPW